MKFVVSILVLLAVTAKQCASFEPQALDDKHQIAVPEEQEIGAPACVYQKGTLDDFNNEIYSWWAGEGFTLSKVGDTLKADAKGVGSKWNAFGREMTLLDFSNCPVLKIRCRAEGEKPPTLIVHMKDVNNYDANADAPKQRIHIGKDFRDYYFSFNNRWKQSWPDNQIVDPKMMNSILLFINGGMADWTGVLYIDDIKAVSLDQLPVVAATSGGIIDDFSDELYSWWAANEKINLEKKGDAMLLDCNGAGSNYETFGRSINEMDFTKAQIVRIKARAEGGEPMLRIDFKDKNGHTTNEFPAVNKILETPDYKDYYYNYSGKYSQTYPDKQTVDPTGMKDLIGFVNPGGPGFIGKIYIEEIEVIDDKKYQQLTGKQ